MSKRNLLFTKGRGSSAPRQSPPLASPPKLSVRKPHIPKPWPRDYDICRPQAQEEDGETGHAGYGQSQTGAVCEVPLRGQLAASNLCLPNMGTVGTSTQPRHGARWLSGKSPMQMESNPQRQFLLALAKPVSTGVVFMLSWAGDGGPEGLVKQALAQGDGPEACPL